MRMENLTKIIQKFRGIDTKNKLKNINFDFLFLKNKYAISIKIKALSEGNINIAMNKLMKAINEIIKEEKPKAAIILAPLLEETEFCIKRMNFSIEGTFEKFRLSFKNLRFKPKMQGTQEEFYFSDFAIATSTLLNKTIKDVNFTIKGDGLKISSIEGMPTPISFSLDSVTWNEFNIENLYFLRFSKIATTTTTTATTSIATIELPIFMIILILIIIIAIIISIFFFMKRKKVAQQIEK